MEKHSPITKKDQSLLLRVATFVGCKSMKLYSKSGKEIKGTHLAVNSFLKDSEIELTNKT